MQTSEAANIKVPGDETPERRELSQSQLNLPQEEGAGSAMSSQGLGEVDKGSPGEGSRLFDRLEELTDTVKIMANVLKNIQDQQDKKKPMEELQEAASQSLDSMSKVVVEAMKSPT